MQERFPVADSRIGREDADEGFNEWSWRHDRLFDLSLSHSFEGIASFLVLHRNEFVPSVIPGSPSWRGIVDCSPSSSSWHTTTMFCTRPEKSWAPLPSTTISSSRLWASICWITSWRCLSSFSLTVEQRHRTRTYEHHPRSEASSERTDSRADSSEWGEKESGSLRAKWIGRSRYAYHHPHLSGSRLHAPHSAASLSLSLLCPSHRSSHAVLASKEGQCVRKIEVWRRVRRRRDERRDWESALLESLLSWK